MTTSSDMGCFRDLLLSHPDVFGDVLDRAYGRRAYLGSADTTVVRRRPLLPLCLSLIGSCPTRAFRLMVNLPRLANRRSFSVSRLSVTSPFRLPPSPPVETKTVVRTGGPSITSRQDPLSQRSLRSLTPSWALGEPPEPVQS